LITKTEFSTDHCTMRPAGVSNADDSSYTIRSSPGDIQWPKRQERDALGRLSTSVT
jgi:hypothetical protein